MKISGVVTAFNEEAKIEACLRSLREVCDEIIVLDSGSTDRTVAIAQNLGAEVFNQAFQGYVEQKNTAIQFAKNEWILSLDADEVLSKELIKAIHQINAPLPKTAFRFKRLNNYCGQWIRHGAWYPDRKIRLWHQHYGTCGGQNPHDQVMVQAGVAIVDIPYNILHYSYDKPEDLRKQCEKFAAIARSQLKMNGNFAWRIPHLRALFKFCRDYFFKFGLLDGRAGLIIAFHNARYTYLKYAKHP